MASQMPPPAAWDLATISVTCESDALSGKPGAGDMLELSGGGSLSISGDALVYREGIKQAEKRGRGSLCGIGGSGAPQSKTIPLYNILFADTTDGSIHINYADQTSPTRIVVTKLRVPLPYSDAPTSADTVATSFIDRLLSLSYGPAKLKKRAYVLVNPHAGPGGAEGIWQREVEPVFQAAHMDLTVVHTKYSGEAVKLVEELDDLTTYDTVIPCSGDGLPHEVFNGMANRRDARMVLGTVSVSHIPCGSGNAMSCNLYGTHRPGLAALAIVKGVVTPMDLVSITQGDRRTISFLSQALGIVAESDLATEHLRWMGEQRFTYGFVSRIFGKKTYPCDLAVKVAVEGKDGVRAHYKRERSEEAVNKLVAGTGSESGGSRVAAGCEASGAESELPSPYESDEADGEGLPRLRYGTIQDELPAGWEMARHDNMGNFYCGNMAYMAPDANFFSAALASDGYMDLVCVDGDISPAASLKLMLSVESGHFFDNPLVSYRKIEAFRIIPRDQDDGYISIDGERVPFEPFQAEVHRGLGRVLSKRGGFEAPGPRDWDSVSRGERLRA
ncbi:hypothetical protein MKZ38_000273 [Zalerion maritima]|uniref:DAGKc domain-containing protein n=1 Tax=Zalerion maritima TaxID=339359 RepID=A0AAD5RT29_9PEZI|nr:hypothetical protein MKZ38_000273 [Zalerion maritima]